MGDDGTRDAVEALRGDLLDVLDVLADSLLTIPAETLTPEGRSAQR